MSDRGFTLIELMTVLVLIGVVASLAVPRLDFRGYAMAGEVRAVGSTLLLAQRRAVQQQHAVVVAFDVAGGRLRIHDDVNGNLLIDGGETVRYQPLGDAVRFGRGVAPRLFASGADVTFTMTQGVLPAVVFHRNGSASEEGGFYLTSARGVGDPASMRHARAVEIQRSTGRPRWYRHDGSRWVRDR